MQKTTAKRLLFVSNRGVAKRPSKLLYIYTSELHFATCRAQTTTVWRLLFACNSLTSALRASQWRNFPEILNISFLNFLYDHDDVITTE